MTMNQAAALRVRWKERADLSTDCEHLNLELEWNDLGHSTGQSTSLSVESRLSTNPKHPPATLA